MTVFLDCHQNASRFLSGVPAEILYDNMKNVVAAACGKTAFNSTFLDFTAHYDFKPAACPPYSPCYLGKVERPIALSNSLCCSTRSIFTCAWSVNSPISSRKTIPLSARSKMPRYAFLSNITIIAHYCQI